MKKETITIIKLEANEGMILTDGQEYGTEIYLGEGRKPEEFSEIPLEEYNEKMAAEMPEII